MKLQIYYPTKPWYVNQPFGTNPAIYKQFDINGHNGIDSFALDGAEVRAAHYGVVTFSGEDGGGGLGVVLRTLKTFDYKDKLSFFKTIYWHLKPGTFRVKPGQIVEAGDILGLADNTGFSTGSHLHFGLKPIA